MPRTLTEKQAEQAKQKKRRTELTNLNRTIAKAISGFKPPENLTVSEWADKYRRLSPESSAETGLWRTSRTPYLKEIMDSFNDPKVRHIVFVSSSQVGKSEAMNNIIGYIISQDPGSILFVQPTTVDAKEYSKLRIAPMIRDCKELRSRVAVSKSRDTGNTILQKSYPGGILTMCGSTEAHSLASKPIRYILGDERDRWATSAGNEGDPWELAQARQITFYNSKSVEVSTPTIKGASAIETAYGTGTQERWKTRCPHCKEYSEITFESIRFDKEETAAPGDKKIYTVSNIYYICPACGAVSTEAEIKRQPAKWVADNPEALTANNTRSFWLSSWVSPWASWSSTIQLYLQALGNTEKMQVVYNTRFGLLWENRGDLESEDTIMARRENYDAELPDGVLLLTMGVDTQDDRLEYEVVGHGHFGETWGIKKGVIMGRPDSEDVWPALDDVINHVYKFGNGVGLKISMTFVDEGGHFTQDVRLHCRERQGRKVFAIKGRGGDGIPYTSMPRQQKIMKDGRFAGMTYVWEIGVDSGKQVIMDNLRVQSPGPKYCHYPRRDDYGTAYFKGLLSEHKVYNPKHKNPWSWEKIPGHERNEPLDVRNYALAAAKALSPDYDALEDRIRSAVPNEETAVATTHAAEKKPPRKRVTKLKDTYNDW